MQVASLPAGLPAFPTSASALRESALKNIPSIQSALADVSSKLRGNSRLSFPIPDMFFRHVGLTSAMGLDGRAPVILLEDVHANVEAQAHLSQALQTLGSTPGASPILVGLEGASGEFMFDVYRTFPDRRAAKAVADAALSDGTIAGPSHAGFVSEQKSGERGLTFWGIDDKELYRSNVAAYRITANRKQEVLDRVLSIEVESSDVKSKTFNPELAAFDRTVEQYRKGQLGFGDYVALLAGRLETASIAVETFVQAYKTEKSIDFARVESERAVVLEKLVRRMSAEDAQLLVRASIAYQDGSLSFGGYYAHLKNLCSKYRIDLRATPRFDEYIRYVLLSDGINASDLFEDVSRMENEIYGRLCRTEREKQLVVESRQLHLIQGLVEFSLTPDQWKRYQEHRHLFAGRLELAAFERFYTSAEARNRKMVDNIMEAWTNRRAPAVLVVGGFHTEGLTTLLSARNIPVLVATPKITKIDSDAGTHYLSVFDREKTPLEQIFSGQRLFLAGVPAGAAAPLVDGPNPMAGLAEQLKALAAVNGDAEHLAQTARVAARFGIPNTPVALTRHGQTIYMDQETPTAVVRTVVTPDGVSRPWLNRMLWKPVAAAARVDGVTISVYSRPRLTVLTRVFSNLFDSFRRMAWIAVPVSAAIAALMTPQGLAVAKGAAVLIAGLPFGAMVILAVAMIAGVNFAVRWSDLPPTARPVQPLLTIYDKASQGTSVWTDDFGKHLLLAPGENLDDIDLVKLHDQLFGDNKVERTIAVLRLLESRLARMMLEEGVLGQTSNQSIFLDGVKKGQYNRELETLVRRGVTDPIEAYDALYGIVTKISGEVWKQVSRQRSVSKLFEHSPEAVVSQETKPDNALDPNHAVAKIVTEARQILERGTQVLAKLAALAFGATPEDQDRAIFKMISRSVSRGVIPNVTLVFGPDLYVLTVHAFLDGLARRVLAMDKQGMSYVAIRKEVERLSASVNSVFVSRVDVHGTLGFDALIDKRMDALAEEFAGVSSVETRDAIHFEMERLELLRGKVGIANTKITYAIFASIFLSQPLSQDVLTLFPHLAERIRSARGLVETIYELTESEPGSADGLVPMQRFLVASSANKKVGTYSDLIYIIPFLGPYVVNTLPPAGRTALLKAIGENRIDNFNTISGGIPMIPYTRKTIGEFERSVLHPNPLVRMASPSSILGEANELLDTLLTAGKLPAELVEIARARGRTVPTVSDVAYALRDDGGAAFDKAQSEAYRIIADQLTVVSSKLAQPLVTIDTENVGSNAVGLKHAVDLDAVPVVTRHPDGSAFRDAPTSERIVEIQRTVEADVPYEQLVKEERAWRASHTRVQEIQDTKDVADKIRDLWLSDEVEDVVIVGIGGSDLGARAWHEALNGGELYNLAKDRQGPRVHFAGDGFFGTPIRKLDKVVDWKKTAVVVISKSGETAEPFMTWSLLKQRMQKAMGSKKYGAHVVAVTGLNEKSLLFKENMGLSNDPEAVPFLGLLPVPDGVGGRYSVFSPVGLIYAGITGLDIDELLAGYAESARLAREIPAGDPRNVPYSLAAVIYAYAVKNGMLKNNKLQFIIFGAMKATAEWFRQGFNESLGKAEHVGLTADGSVGSTDNHSSFQRYLEGANDSLFVLTQVDSGDDDLRAPADLDPALSYLAGRSLGEAQRAVRAASATALRNAQRPNVTLHLSAVNERALGKYMGDLMRSWEILGHLYRINPFNQPAVQLYKKETVANLEAMARPPSKPVNRSILNRFALALPFAITGLINVGLFFVFAHRFFESQLFIASFVLGSLVIVISVFGTIKFVLQAVPLILVKADQSPLYEIIPEARDLPGLVYPENEKRNPYGRAASVIEGAIYVNKDMFRRLHPEDQRAILNEERRHVRYQEKHGLADAQNRSLISRMIEEITVNVVMPITEMWTSPVPAVDVLLPAQLSLENWATHLRRSVRIIADSSNPNEKLEAVVTAIERSGMKQRVVHRLLEPSYRQNERAKIRLVTAQLLEKLGFFDELRSTMNFNVGPKPPIDVLAEENDFTKETAFKIALATYARFYKRGEAPGEEAKDDIDTFAEDVLLAIAKNLNKKLVFLVAEGAGSDAVQSTIAGSREVNPDATGGVLYILIDVIENTNAASTNNNGRNLDQLTPSDAGAIVIITEGDRVWHPLSGGPLMDMYTDTLITKIPPERRAAFGELKPEFNGDPNPTLSQIAEANGIGLNRLVVKCLARPREAERISSLLPNIDRQVVDEAIAWAEKNHRQLVLQDPQTGMLVELISDGTFIHALQAMLGRNPTWSSNGKLSRYYRDDLPKAVEPFLIEHDIDLAQYHPVLWTTGKTSEGFSDLAIAFAMSVRGAEGAIVVYSKEVQYESSADNNQKSSRRKKSRDLKRRFAFDQSQPSNENLGRAMKESDWIRTFRADTLDSQEILSGEKIFSTRRGLGKPGLRHATVFLTDSGVAEVEGVRALENGRFMATGLFVVETDNRHLYVYPDAMVDPYPLSILENAPRPAMDSSVDVSGPSTVAAFSFGLPALLLANGDVGLAGVTAIAFVAIALLSRVFDGDLFASTNPAPYRHQFSPALPASVSDVEIAFGELSDHFKMPIEMIWSLKPYFLSGNRLSADTYQLRLWLNNRNSPLGEVTMKLQNGKWTIDVFAEREIYLQVLLAYVHDVMQRRGLADMGSDYPGSFEVNRAVDLLESVEHSFPAQFSYSMAYPAGSSLEQLMSRLQRLISDRERSFPATYNMAVVGTERRGMETSSTGTEFTVRLARGEEVIGEMVFHQETSGWRILVRGATRNALSDITKLSIDLIRYLGGKIDGSALLPEGSESRDKTDGRGKGNPGEPATLLVGLNLGLASVVSLMVAAVMGVASGDVAPVLWTLLGLPAAVILHELFHGASIWHRTGQSPRIVANKYLIGVEPSDHGPLTMRDVAAGPVSVVVMIAAFFAFPASIGLPLLVTSVAINGLSLLFGDGNVLFGTSRVEGLLWWPYDRLNVISEGRYDTSKLSSQQADGLLMGGFDPAFIQRTRELRSAREARSRLSFYTKTAGKPLAIRGQFRAFDGPGSSQDLPFFQRLLTWIVPRRVWQFASTLTVPSQLGITIEFMPHENPDVIEYVAPEYGFSEENPYVHDTRNPVKRKADGTIAPADLVPFIFHEIFDLSGIKVKIADIDPIATAGGMETSNVFVTSVIAAASMMSGANLTKADIFNMAVAIENVVGGGLTGGQGHLNALYRNQRGEGGIAMHVWLSGPKGRYGALSIPVNMTEAQERDLTEHMMLVQAGVNYKNGKKIVNRLAAFTNDFWTDMLTTFDKEGYPRHMRKPQISARYWKALAGGDWETVRDCLNEYAQIRDEITKRWLQITLAAKAALENSEIPAELNIAVEDIPDYAFEWARAAWDPSHPDYNSDKNDIVRKLFDQYGTKVATEISLYSLDPIAPLAEAARKEGIGVFPLGAGGPGSILGFVDPRGQDHLREFLGRHGLSEFTEERKEEIHGLVTGKIDGELKGYLPLVISKESMTFSGFREAGFDLPGDPVPAYLNQRTGEVILKRSADAGSFRLVKPALYVSGIVAAAAILGVFVHLLGAKAIPLAFIAMMFSLFRLRMVGDSNGPSYWAARVQWIRNEIGKLTPDQVSMDAFKTYDVRTFNPEHDLGGAMGAAMAVGYHDLVLDKMTAEFGLGFAMRRPLVIVGRDARATSRTWQEAGMDGLYAAGADIIDLGSIDPNHIAEFYFALSYYASVNGHSASTPVERPVLGLFYTASHVQGHVGGIKGGFAMKKGVASLSSAEVAGDYPRVVKEFVENPELPGQGGTVERRTVREPYLRLLRILGGALRGVSETDWSYLVRFWQAKESVGLASALDEFSHDIDTSVKPLAGLRLLIDTGHAAAGLTAPRIFRELGADVEEMHTDVRPIGDEHIADPSRADLRQPAVDRLKAAMKGKKKFDAAILYDLDGDRGVMILVLPNGETIPLTGDRVGALVGPILAKAFGTLGKELVVGHDVKSSLALRDSLPKGTRVIEAKTGYPNVLSAIEASVNEAPGKRLGLMFVEQSGHLGTLLTDMKEDPTITMLLILRAAAANKRARPARSRAPSGLVASYNAIPNYVSSEDLRAPVHPDQIREFEPSYDPAKAKPSGAAFKAASDKALGVLKEKILGWGTFTLTVGGEKQRVRVQVGNEIDRMKISFVDTKTKQEIAWANFRFSGNDGTWSVSIDGKDSPWVKPLATQILRTMDRLKLADFRAEKYAGREEALAMLAGTPGDKTKTLQSTWMLAVPVIGWMMGGLPGLLLIVAGLVWLAAASLSMIHVSGNGHQTLQGNFSVPIGSGFVDLATARRKIAERMTSFSIRDPLAVRLEPQTGRGSVITLTFLQAGKPAGQTHINLSNGELTVSVNATSNTFEYVRGYTIDLLYSLGMLNLGNTTLFRSGIVAAMRPMVYRHVTDKLLPHDYFLERQRLLELFGVRHPKATRGGLFALSRRSAETPLVLRLMFEDDHDGMLVRIEKQTPSLGFEVLGKVRFSQDADGTLQFETDVADADFLVAFNVALAKYLHKHLPEYIGENGASDGLSELSPVFSYASFEDKSRHEHPTIYGIGGLVLLAVLPFMGTSGWVVLGIIAALALTNLGVSRFAAPAENPEEEGIPTFLRRDNLRLIGDEMRSTSPDAIRVAGLFKTYDVRSDDPANDLLGGKGAAMAVGLLNFAVGVFNDEVGPQFASERPLVIVGRDARKASRQQQEAGMAGVYLAGAEVIDMGSMSPNHIAEFYFAIDYYYSVYGKTRPILGMFYTASHVQGDVGGIKAGVGSKDGVRSLTPQEVVQRWPAEVKAAVGRDLMVRSSGDKWVRPWRRGQYTTHKNIPAPAFQLSRSLRREYVDNVLILGGAALSGAATTSWDYLRDYWQRLQSTGLERTIRSYFGRKTSDEVLTGEPLKDMRILVDTGHAGVGLTAPAIYRQLGAEVEELHTDVHEIGAKHRADPSRADLRQAAIDRMREAAEEGEPFDLAVLYDLDGDRGQINVMMPDGSIVALDGDIVGALVARILAKAFAPEGRTMVIGHDVKSSDALRESVPNVVSVEAMTGYPNVKAAMEVRVAAINQQDGPDGLGLAFIEKSGHLGTLLTFMKEDPTVSALLILREANLTEGGLPALLSSLPAYQSTQDIRPPVHEFMIKEFKPDYTPAQGKPDSETFAQASKLALEALNAALLDVNHSPRNHLLDVDGQPRLVRAFLVNHTDKLKIRFMETPSKPVAWANFRFSGNDGSWSIVFDGPRDGNPLFEHLVRYVLAHMKANQLADLDAAGYAGKEDADRYLGDQTPPETSVTLMGSWMYAVPLIGLFLMSAGVGIGVVALALGLAWIAFSAYRLSTQLGWVSSRSVRPARFYGLASFIILSLGLIPTIAAAATTGTFAAQEWTFVLALIAVGVSIVGMVFAALYYRTHETRHLATRALRADREFKTQGTDNVLSFLIHNGPHGAFFGQQLAVDVRLHTSEYINEVVQRQADTAIRLTSWAYLVAYLESIRRVGNQIFTNPMPVLMSVLSSHRSNVMVVNVGEIASKVEEDLKLVDRIISRTRQEEDQSGDIIVAVHPDLSEESLMELQRLLQDAPRNVILLPLSGEHREEAVYSYDKILASAAEAAGPGRLMAVEQLTRGIYADSNFISFSRIPANFVADRRLRAIWTIITNMSAGWVAFTADQIETIIEAAALAGKQA